MYYDKNGSYLIGWYKDSKPHGKAKKFYKDGKVEDRFYVNGIIEKKEADHSDSN